MLNDRRDYAFFAMLFKQANAQTKIEELRLDSVLADIDIRGESISAVLSEVALRFRIPIGFENLLTDGTGCRLVGVVNIRAKNLRVDEAMNLIESQTTNCEWVFIRGAINFRSRLSDRQMGEVLLKDFGINSGTSKKQIKLAIQSSSQWKDILRTNEYLTFLLDPSSDNSPVSAGFHLNKGEYELRCVLNKIAKETTSKYWSLQKWSNSESAIVLTF